MSSRKSTNTGRNAVLTVVGAVLGTLLVVSAWGVRGVLFSERAAVELDRKLRPGRFEERIPWARGQVVEAVGSVEDVTETWETETDGEFGVRVKITEATPLEEANRRLREALVSSGLEVLDAVELAPLDDRRRLSMSVGMDGRQVAWAELHAARDEPIQPGPKIALVIDDLGQQPMDLARAFIDVDFPLALTVLPDLRNSAAIVEEARARGREVLLHLPMEPRGYPRENPGKDAILVHLPAGEVKRRVRRALGTVPGVEGISNHMGSLATQDRATMTAVLDVVAGENLYFLDSRTTNRSIVPKIAREQDARCVQNDVFLDNVREAGPIRERLAEAASLARSSGSAVAIFHPHAICLEVIPAEVERLRGEGITFVTLRGLDRGRWIGGRPSG